MRPDQVQQHPVPVGPGQPGQPLAAATPTRRPVGARAGSRGEPAPAGRGRLGTRPRQQRGHVPAPGGQARSPATSSRAGTSSASSRASARSSSARPSAADSSATPPRLIRARSTLAQVPGHAAGVGPQPPGQRGRGQPRRAAAGGQRVQERVRRRVVPLPGAAEGRRGRGEQHERLQVRAGGQLVQVPGRVGLRAASPRRPGPGSATRSPRHPAPPPRGPPRSAAGPPGPRPAARPAPPGRRRHTPPPATPAPAAARSAASAAAPRARPGRTGWPAPAAGPARSPARCRATSPPSVPVPPVTSTVPAIARRRRIRRDHQHDLAGVPGLGHEPERLPRPPHIPRPHRQQRQLTRRQQPRHLRQDLPQPVRTRLTQLERPVGRPPDGPGRPAPGRGRRSCPSR